jgi:peptide/nickel transport system substrate-binding protein
VEPAGGRAVKDPGKRNEPPEFNGSPARRVGLRWIARPHRCILDDMRTRGMRRHGTIAAGLGWLLVGALAGAQAQSEVDRPADPPARTHILFAPVPIDGRGVDYAAVLHRRIRAEPVTLNPIVMYTEIGAEFDYLLWDRPFVIGPDLAVRLNPQVATSYVEADDHLSARLSLRPDLRWHDGAPYTADDIVFSWRRIMDDRVICRKARTGPDQLADCRAVDAITVEFQFKQALPANRLFVDFPILPRHLYEPLMAPSAPLWGAPEAVALSRRGVGNGPYRFVEWIDGQRIVLARWDDYSGPRPAFRKIVFHVIPDNHAALLAFETGRIDETPLTPQQYARETDGPRFREIGIKTRDPGWTTYCIGWNLRDENAFVGDVRVRWALSHALDKRLIVERVFFGLFDPADSIFHPDSLVGPVGISPRGFDLRQAGELLDRAGWRRDPDDGWRYRASPDADGGRIPAGFTLNLVRGSQTSPKIADIFAQSLRKLGVRMRTQVLEWSVFNERNFAGEFDAYLGAWSPGPDPDDAWNLLHSQARAGGRNYPGFSDARVDALLAEGRILFDPTERQACYRALARRVHARAPYTFLVSAANLWAFDRNLRGVQAGPRGPTLHFPGVRGWWRPVPRDASVGIP